MDNSAVCSVDASRGTVVTSVVERLSVLKSIVEDFKEDELGLLLKNKAAPVCSVWFMPSPWMHIAQGIMKTAYVNKMVKAGFKVWKAAGMDLDRVELVWLSDVMNAHAANFWPLVMDIGQRNTVDNIKRCCRKTFPYGPGILQATELLLPWLQCAAMLFQEVDIWLLDSDQREVSILARKYCEDIKRGNGPIILLNHTLPDLLEYPQVAEQLDPSRAISMDDIEDDVNFKIMFRAFCPPGAVKRNPCLDYIKCVVLPWCGEFEVVHEESGRRRIFTSMEKLIANYRRGTLSSADVKLALEKAINKILQPIHEHFRNNADAKALREANKKYYLKH